MPPGKVITKEMEKAAYETAMAWDQDVILAVKRNARAAWIVAAVAVLVAAPFVIRVTLFGPGEPAYPVVIMVDRATGNMEVVETPNKRMVSDYQPLIDAHWAKKYVTHRESYYYPLLQLDYDMVLAMSADTVAIDYAKQFEGEHSPEKKLTNRYEIKIDVLSVVLPPDEQGKAVVRFRKVMRQAASGNVESAQTLVATFAYEYVPSVRGKVSQLINNPLGYKVTSYRTDVELAPTAQVGS